MRSSSQETDDRQQDSANANANPKRTPPHRFRVFKRELLLADIALGIAGSLLATIAGLLFANHPRPALFMFASGVAVGLTLLHLHYRHGYKRKQKIGRATISLFTAAILSFMIAIVDLAMEAAPNVADPFRAEVRAAMIHDALGPLSLFMVGYNSMYGRTASPVVYLVYLQVVNLQDVPSTIANYSVAVSDNETGPWGDLVPIPLVSSDLYALGTNQPGHGTIAFPRGAYRLGTSMQREDMTKAALMNPSPKFDVELSQPIQPHDTVRGWAAFGTRGRVGEQVRNYFRVTLRDTADVSFASIAALYRCSPDDVEADTAIALMDKMGPILDISDFHVRYYGEPYPHP